MSTSAGYKKMNKDIIFYSERLVLIIIIRIFANIEQCNTNLIYDNGKSINERG